MNSLDMMRSLAHERGMLRVRYAGTQSAKAKRAMAFRAERLDLALTYLAIRCNKHGY